MTIAIVTTVVYKSYSTSSCGCSAAARRPTGPGWRPRSAVGEANSSPLLKERPEPAAASRSLIMSRRDLDFLLYDWLAADSLPGRERFTGHSRSSFNSALDLAADIAAYVLLRRAASGTSSNRPSVRTGGCGCQRRPVPRWTPPRSPVARDGRGTYGSDDVSDDVAQDAMLILARRLGVIIGSFPVVACDVATREPDGWPARRCWRSSSRCAGASVPRCRRP